ncbi:zinc-dependent metalloprotease [Pararcticibacter amylolyticus]|uniref:Metalloprotease n=1 Tax=Pararcticibacter amylolyticus TaxID=2173175 RepID=A0A2U2PMX7_9SPHI|nr:zinc-dependent metalloprotease [Pararcticibacter amylolyticus]PWG82678.1 metalloprotease [Pararcticibacter amylolyticus]
MKFFRVILFFILAFSCSAELFSQTKGKSSGKTDKKKTESRADSADTDKKSSGKSYKELLKKATTVKGIFDVHRVDNDFYFEIPLRWMQRDFLLVNKISSVPLSINEAGINKGMNTENKVIRFSLNKRAGTVWVKTIVPQVESPAADAITQSVRDNFTGSVIESFKIEAYNTDSSAVVVKVNRVFDGTDKSFNDVFNDIGLGTSVKTSLSAIENIKAFPQNLVVKSLLSTTVTEGSNSLPVSVKVTTNVLLLPEIPMVPRFGDKRIGFFTTPRWYFSDRQQQMESRELITRWRLEPKPEDRERYKRGELVEPIKPIIFFIDPATPRQWVGAIKSGINDWQKAFEQAGFKNAIQAKEVRDTADFDADDVRYSVVTYAASPKSNAMGPAVIDPRSGEILESDVIWWHNVMTSLKYWMRIQTGAIDSAARARNLSETLMANAIRFVSSHEIGHTLGLKHNMGASAAFPVDSLRSPSFTARMGGTAPSIMDYARFNYVAQPEDNVRNINPQIGVYDKYAIEWGYRWLDMNDPHQELPVLQNWLRKHENDPLYKYGEQQESQNIVDPRSQSEDLGDNSVKASYYGLQNLRRIVPQISTIAASEGDDYYEAGKLLLAAIQQWQMYAGHVTANIGGFYLENAVKGDGKGAWMPVPVQRQEEAFNFLRKEVFSMPEWLVEPQLLSKFLPTQDSPVGPFEYTPYNVRRNAQYDVIYKLFADERLMRMTEAEAFWGKEHVFTATELFGRMHAEAFRPTIKGRSLGIYDRMFQQNFVDALLVSSGKLLEKLSAKSLHDECHYMQVDEGFGGEHVLRNINVSLMSRTSEAAMLKRAELLKIFRLLERKQKSGDEVTRAHYQDLMLRIRRGLNIQ